MVAGSLGFAPGVKLHFHLTIVEYERVDTDAVAPRSVACVPGFGVSRTTPKVFIAAKGTRDFFYAGSSNLCGEVAHGNELVGKWVSGGL